MALHYKTSVIPIEGKQTYATYEEFTTANLGIDTDSLDRGSIEVLLEQASRLIDDFTDRVFYPILVENEKAPTVFNRFEGSFRVHTRHKPIIDVASIGVTGPKNLLSLLVEDDWDIFHEQGYVDIFPQSIYYIFGNVHVPSGLGTINSIISYKAGYEEIPAAVKRSTILLVKNMLFPGQLLSGAKTNEAFNGGSLKRVQSQDYVQEVDTKTGAEGRSVKMTMRAEQDLLFTSDIRAMLRLYIRRGIK